MVVYNLYSPYVDISTLPFFDRITILRLSAPPINKLVLPPRLIEFHCCRIGLENLPELLPKTLKVLVCKNNKITKLPKLPYGLRTLDCSNNPLLELGDLPNLVFLNCSGCGLTVLPDLPSTLIALNCCRNYLIHLPRLFEGLKILRCNDNMLKELIRLPTSLTDLDCRSNQINEIDNLDELINLINLDCRFNKVALYTHKTTKNEKLLMSLHNSIVKFRYKTQ